MEIDRGNCALHHPNAFGGKRLLQNAQGDNGVHTLGGAPSRLRKILLLIETQIDSKTIEYDDWRDRSENLTN